MVVDADDRFTWCHNTDLRSIPESVVRFRHKSTLLKEKKKMVHLVKDNVSEVTVGAVKLNE